MLPMIGYPRGPGIFLNGSVNHEIILEMAKMMNNVK